LSVGSILAALLGLAGLVLVAQGLWIPTKAWVAQRLIERAWENSLGGQAEIRPWPWADTWPIARLRLPSVEEPLYALAGASGQALAFGPAHVSASAQPSERDNVVFAGHRDTHFASLRQLEIGDEIVIETAISLMRYRIVETAVVHESRMDLLDRTGRAELRLITCYPFDSIIPGGPLRYVVHAVAFDEESNIRPSIAIPEAPPSFPASGKQAGTQNRDLEARSADRPIT
jgi:sortase A